MTASSPVRCSSASLAENGRQRFSLIKSLRTPTPNKTCHATIQLLRQPNVNCCPAGGQRNMRRRVVVLRIDYKASGNADDTRQSNRGRLAGTKPAARASYRLADKFIKSPLACLATLATLPRLAKAATSFHDAKADVFVTMGVLNGCKHATNPWSGLSKACGLTAVDSPANVSLLPLPALYDGQGCQERSYGANISSTTAQWIIEYF